jgi:hypothetical protein
VILKKRELLFRIRAESEIILGNLKDSVVIAYAYENVLSDGFPIVGKLSLYNTTQGTAFIVSTQSHARAWQVDPKSIVRATVLEKSLYSH